MKNTMTTFTGRHFDPMQIKTEDICMEDIAHALSLTCRGGGHLKYFYSVAQHSLNCSAEAKARGWSGKLQLACLLHDASEAYISDIIRPVKANLTGYLEIESRIMEKILEKYSYTAITVTLTGNYLEIYRRFVERNNSPDRHRGHVVNDGYPEKNPGGPVCPVPYEDFVKGITDRGMDRFAANGPHITVDTTDFEKVRIERVIRLKNVPDGPFFNRQFCVGAPQNCYDRSRKITYAIFRRGRSKKRSDMEGKMIDDYRKESPGEIPFAK